MKALVVGTLLGIDPTTPPPPLSSAAVCDSALVSYQKRLSLRRDDLQQTKASHDTAAVRGLAPISSTYATRKTVLLDRGHTDHVDLDL